MVDFACKANETTLRPSAYTNCPTFRGTVPIFDPKFAAVPLFLHSVQLFLQVFGHYCTSNKNTTLLIIQHLLPKNSL